MKIRIPIWVVGPIKFMLDFIQTRFIEKLPDFARDFLTMSLTPLKAILDVLSDDNEADGDQIEEILRKFANGDLANFTEAQVALLIDKLDDASLKIVLNKISVPSFNMLRLLTDDNPDNANQLATMWGAFAKDPATHAVILDHLLEPLLENVIPEASLRAIILDLIAQGLVEATNDLPGGIEKSQAIVIADKFRKRAAILKAAA